MELLPSISPIDPNGSVSERSRGPLERIARESSVHPRSLARTSGPSAARAHLSRLKLKFLADEDLRRAIVLGVRRREPSVSFIESFEVGSNGKDDLTVLEIAAGEGRLLVSHDARTMPGHFRAFIARQQSPASKGRSRSRSVRKPDLLETSGPTARA
jgi:hypothetical protein